jgi:hypothetical protein
MSAIFYKFIRTFHLYWPPVSISQHFLFFTHMYIYIYIYNNNNTDTYYIILLHVSFNCTFYTILIKSKYLFKKLNTYKLKISKKYSSLQHYARIFISINYNKYYKKK